MTIRQLPVDIEKMINNLRDMVVYLELMVGVHHKYLKALMDKGFHRDEAMKLVCIHAGGVFKSGDVQLDSQSM